METPISDDQANRPAPKAKNAPKKKAAAKRQPSDGGIRQVSTRRYSQKYLRDIPACHLQQWLEHADGVHANGSVTKNLEKDQLLMMLTFMVGWHPDTEPVESCPQTMLFFFKIVLLKFCSIWGRMLITISFVYDPIAHLCTFLPHTKS